MIHDLSRTERLKLIRRALEFCEGEATPEAVAKQYRYETGEDLSEASVADHLRPDPKP